MDEKCKKCWQEMDEELARAEAVAYDNGFSDGYEEYRSSNELKIEEIRQQVMEEVRDVMSFKQVGLSGYFTIALDEWEDLCGKLGVTV